MKKTQWGEIAVAVKPNQFRIDKIKNGCFDLLSDEAKCRPANWTSEWRDALHNEIALVLAGRELPGLLIPAIYVPRFVHGQSQGICDHFGVHVERQEDGNYFVYPLIPEPGHVDRVEICKIDEGMYWNAVEWIEYARTATRGCFEFRNPVMTGPFDTANYLLGTTVLMEWVYTEPATLHRLLDKITNLIISMVDALRKAAGGILHGEGVWCVPNAFTLCSECRSLVSAETFEEFEAPYLARIGRQLGYYGIHSCGSWERSIPASLKDSNLRVMNGQVRENDLASLCELAKGEIILSIGQSHNLDERYTWTDKKSFFEYVIKTVPDKQPLEVCIDESELELWNETYKGNL